MAAVVDADDSAGGKYLFKTDRNVFSEVKLSQSPMTNKRGMGGPSAAFCKWFCDANMRSHICTPKGGDIEMAAMHSGISALADVVIKEPYE